MSWTREIKNIDGGGGRKMHENLYTTDYLDMNWKGDTQWCFYKQISGLSGGNHLGSFIVYKVPFTTSQMQVYRRFSLWIYYEYHIQPAVSLMKVPLCP